jgi:DNA invertase Pin-like site-specific DNA recombinase
MDKPVKKLLRCAVYTRKSTDHNLDLEFNSLDAQREACEAYIKSQAHEGWRLIPEHYDDGAFSGASLDRPALQQLLAEVRAGNVDVIVVYKVDRLTRSLADFAKLVELFDQHSVSFVSITQSFNTTSSMGRLTLNVLLSFAQFEREVIGERVRDKIAASKRKGIWVGGPVPLGYASVGKKLVVVPQEAESVRLIFRRYLEVGSVRDLAEDLERKGVRTRRQTLATGKTRGGIPFGVGALANLLRNQFYTGEIEYRGAKHAGEHEAIVEQALFEAVQAKLAAGAQARQLRLRASPAILTGRIFDEHGNRMTPTHTNKRGARYRYYVSHSALQKRSRGNPSMRVPAQDIEDLVVNAIREYLSAHLGDQFTALGDRELIERYVGRVTVGRGAIDILIVGEGGSKFASQNNDSSQTLTIRLEWTKDGVRSEKGVLHQPQSAERLSIGQRDLLLKAIAKARSWIEDLTAGRVASFGEIAKREGKVERHIRLLAPLAFASPQIVSKIAEGSFPPIGVTDLVKGMPYLWAEQSRSAGLP